MKHIVCDICMNDAYFSAPGRNHSKKVNFSFDKYLFYDDIPINETFGKYLLYSCVSILIFYSLQTKHIIFTFLPPNKEA